jgi:hypothetical protein
MANHTTRAEDLAGRIRATIADRSILSVANESGVPCSTLNRNLDSRPENFTVQQLSKLAVALDANFSVIFEPKSEAA